MTLRSLLFWLHLVAGVSAGLVVLVMSATGVALTFQPQHLEASRASLSTLTIPDGAGRWPLEALVEKATATKEAKATAVTVREEPASAVLVRFGRSDGVYLHPWTGEVLADPAAGWQAVYRTLTGWHRWLGATESRAAARAVTGASNLAFAFLALSGLYLWFPRRWTSAAVRAVVWFRRSQTSQARDFNWHHVFGFWSAAALLALTLSGAVISYDWAKSLVYAVAGDVRPPPDKERAPPEAVRATAHIGQPALTYDALIARAAETAPGWSSLTLTLPVQDAPVHLSLQRAGQPPPYATVELALEPVTGEVLARRAFEDQSSGRRLRGFLRFLHTGEALGWPGQLAAGVASLAGVVLVWTGLALSWRRFVRFRARRRTQARRAT